MRLDLALSTVRNIPVCHGSFGDRSVFDDADETFFTGTVAHGVLLLTFIFVLCKLVKAKSLSDLCPEMQTSVKKS